MAITLADPLPASEKLGSFHLWDWLINLSPGWAFLIMLAITPFGMMYFLRPVVEGRITRFRDDFLTFRMDVMFAPALAIGLMLVGAMEDRPYMHRGTTATVVQSLILVFWIAFGLLHMWQERKFYNWRQGTSPTALYHNGYLYIFAGYALTMVCGMGLLFAPWSLRYVLLRILMLAYVAAWGLSWPLYDEKHKANELGESKFLLAHVPNGWPWQHKYRELPMWWWRYLLSWREAPKTLAGFFNNQP